MYTTPPTINHPLYQDLRTFAVVATLLQIVFIIIYACTADYADMVQAQPGGGSGNGSSGGGMDFYYPIYQDIHVMIMIGFGCLMTFMERFTLGGIGFTFLTVALTLQWALLTNGFWHNVHTDHWATISFDILSLIRADFACGAVLISYGAVLGSITPLQLLVMAVVECVVFGANEYIGVSVLGAVDMGGSIFVHTFGAYFGLAVSRALVATIKTGEADEEMVASSALPSAYTSPTSHTQDTRSDTHTTVPPPSPLSTKTTNTFAMIGTHFLWCFWPSFNGALATGSQQHRVVVNTVLALSGSCVSTFVASAVFRSGFTQPMRFSMVDIQNAALAGGVAVGSSSDLVIRPWGAVLVGCTAGVVSVAGFTWLTEWMEHYVGVRDVCGVHNLHGLPGIMGALGGAVSAALAGSEAYGESVTTIFPARADTCRSSFCGLSASEQAGYQVAALAVTLGMALVGGSVTGKLMRGVSGWRGGIRDVGVFEME